MIKLKDILNESKWTATSENLDQIMKNLFLGPDAQEILDEVLPKVSSVSNAVNLINQNRKKLAELLTKYDYTQLWNDNTKDYDHDLNLYIKAADSVYNSTETQTIINNVIMDVINNLSIVQLGLIKTSWSIKSKETIKANIKHSIAKIALQDIFRIKSDEPGNNFAAALTTPAFEMLAKKETVYNSDPLTDSIYNTLDNKLSIF